MPRRRADPLPPLRLLCLALPEVTERMSHGSPSWFVGARGASSGKQFVSFVDHHHGTDIVGLWCPAPLGVQEAVIASEPERFYRPPYVGHRGWIGVRLDVDVDWEEVDEIVRDAYRCVAPKRLVALLDQST